LFQGGSLMAMQRTTGFWVCTIHVYIVGEANLVLGYLFRATSGGIMRVAGLAPVLLPGVENYDVTEWVPGHMSYRSAMPRLLREVGWIVESDEFTEIEDPDPENHEKRQRELINEIEEARKQLQEKPKSRFAFFKRKKLVEKKEWEMYDDAVRNGTDDKESLEGKANGVLFDIDALQKEVADLAAQGITVKELPQSTLPPMKLVLGSSGPSTPEKRSILGVDDRSHSAPPSKSAFTPHLASTSFTNLDTSPLASSSMKALGTAGAVDSAAGAGVATAHEHSLERSATSPASPEPPPQSVGQTAGQRPTLNSVMTAPLPPINLEHNAWADEFGDDFGKEKELQMTFE
jgi:hypothetical protein